MEKPEITGRLAAIEEEIRRCYDAKATLDMRIATLEHDYAEVERALFADSDVELERHGQTSLTEVWA
jgi:hypothetical protein